MLSEMLAGVRKKAPVVHNITNTVSANDCANILLAVGASPIMADDPEESAEITSHCAGLVLNLGMLHSHTIPAMLAAGRAARELGHPVVIDPVGAGSSRFRTDTAKMLIKELQPAVIRGNMSEIRALATGEAGHRGVDADFRENGPDAAEQFVTGYAQKTGAIIIATGETDLASDGRQCYRVHNGHAMMRLVTGAGCQLSSLVGAFTAANPDRLTEAALAAVCTMGLCGELARQRLGPMDGNASYRNYIIDAVYNLEPEALERGADYELQ